MNTILVVVCIVSFIATLASFIYFVVRDHIHTLKESVMYKPTSSILVNFLREIAGILAVGVAINLLMATVLATGAGSSIVGSIVKKANHNAYEACYWSWKADQQWRAAADRRLAGARGADTTPMDALVTVTQEKAAWEVANWRASQQEAAFKSLDTFEALEADIKAAEDRWMKRIQNW
jgi:hypothetical protein